MMASSEFRGSLGPRVHRGIHGPEQAFLCSLERRRDDGESDIADDHEIDVARIERLAARDRPVDEGPRDAIRERFQHLAQDIDQADGLQQEALQLRE